MIFMGAEDWFFWKGIEAAVFKLCGTKNLGPNISTNTQKRCLEAYMDGFIVGLEISLEEYKELINE